MADHGHHHHDHDAHQHHGHAHAHDHHHHGGATAAAFAIGTALNLGFVVVEAVYGVLGNSIALLSDAGHNLGDGLSLGAAWAAAMLAQRAPSRRYTYGLGSSSILVALMNAIILLIAVGAIILSSAQRLAAPQPVAGVIVIAVALGGVLVHGVTALLLSRGLADLNVKAAYAHMAADAVVGLAVAASGGIILATGWVVLDPLVSIVVAVVIVVATWRILRQALDLALHAVPEAIDAERVRQHLAHLTGVSTIHDLHIWPMSTTDTALTAHLVMPEGHPGDEVLARVAGELQERFAIGHVTLQIEIDPESACRLAPDHVV